MEIMQMTSRRHNTSYILEVLPFLTSIRWLWAQMQKKTSRESYNLYKMLVRRWFLQIFHSSGISNLHILDYVGKQIFLHPLYKNLCF